MTDKPERKIIKISEPCAHLHLVYSGERFVSNPPQWAWVCTRCPATGATPGEKCPSTPNWNRYWYIRKKRDPSLVVPPRGTKHELETQEPQDDDIPEGT